MHPPPIVTRLAVVLATRPCFAFFGLVVHETVAALMALGVVERSLPFLTFVQR